MWNTVSNHNINVEAVEMELTRPKQAATSASAEMQAALLIPRGGDFPSRIRAPAHAAELASAAYGASKAALERLLVSAVQGMWSLRVRFAMKFTARTTVAPSRCVAFCARPRVCSHPASRWASARLLAMVLKHQVGMPGLDRTLSTLACSRQKSLESEVNVPESSRGEG